MGNAIAFLHILAQGAQELTQLNFEIDKRFERLRPEQALFPHLALEETRSGNAEAAQTIERAERISKGLKLPEIQTLKERVTSLVPSAPRRGSQE